MRELTSEEQMKLDRLDAQFTNITDEIRPGLAELAELCQFEPAEQVLENTELFLDTLDVFWKQEDFESAEQDEINWFGARLAQFVTVLLTNRYGGFLQTQDDPDREYFLRYVVSSFESGLSAEAIIDPFELAQQYTRLPLGRSLIKLIDETCRSKTAVG